VVADVTGVSGLSRDAVIFSLGFGKTPHGRFLHRFGALGEVGGDAMLLGTLGATRRRLGIVSGIVADDLSHERLKSDGARLLSEVLEFAQERSGVVDQVTQNDNVSRALEDPIVNRLLVDLGDRLWQMGYLVETDFGLPDGERIPLVVGHPDLPNEMLVAVLTDDPAYVAEPSVRVRDRQAAERLERLGWVVTQTWSAASFLDPGIEADRIRRLVQHARDQRLGNTGDVVPPRDVTELLDEELGEAISPIEVSPVVEVIDLAAVIEADLAEEADVEPSVEPESEEPELAEPIMRFDPVFPSDESDSPPTEDDAPASNIETGPAAK